MLMDRDSGVRLDGGLLRTPKPAEPRGSPERPQSGSDLTKPGW